MYISEYNDNPEIRFLVVDDDTTSPKATGFDLFFGFEFEFECIDQNAHRLKHENHAKKIMKDNPNVWVKWDGSLRNGFEVVTMPMTLDWFLENKYEMTTFFDYLFDNGYALARTGISGEGGAFHVHISRDFFEDDDHIRRFESAILSESEQMIRDGFATVHPYCQVEAYEQVEHQGMNGSYLKNKYVWVRLCEKTVELRMFSNNWLHTWGSVSGLDATMRFIIDKIADSYVA
jgi:hypothetical protein